MTDGTMLKNYSINVDRLQP